MDALSRPKTVKAVRDIGLTRGATTPHIMECSDDKTYVVKFADETKTVVNEYLGYALAHELGLPVPESALAQLSAELIAASPDLSRRGIIPGVHHGSELVAGAFDFEELEKRKAGTSFDVVNFAEIPGVVCLDNWIMTMDRSRKDNHLLQPTPDGFRYLTIDFSHSFTGPDWTADVLKRAANVVQPAPASSMVTSTIAGLESVEPVLNRIESKSDQEILALVASIPYVWRLTQEERASLESFLQKRRGLVRGIVTSSLTKRS